MYCSHCDQHFPDHHRFCSDCGRPFEKKYQGTFLVPGLVLAGMFAVGLLVWLFI